VAAVRTDARKTAPDNIRKVDVQSVAHGGCPREGNKEIRRQFPGVALPDAFEGAHGEPLLVHQKIRQGEQAIVREAVDVANAPLELCKRVLPGESHDRPPRRNGHRRADRHEHSLPTFSVFRQGVWRCLFEKPEPTLRRIQTNRLAPLAGRSGAAEFPTFRRTLA